jgi:hypothetical protein
MASAFCSVGCWSRHGPGKRAAVALNDVGTLQARDALALGLALTYFAYCNSRTLGYNLQSRSLAVDRRFELGEPTMTVAEIITATGGALSATLLSLAALVRALSRRR